jgi:protein-arginine kinase activator protein McsA
VNVSSRVCPHCHQARALDDFALDRHKASGFKSVCRACDNARSRAYYREHRQAVIDRVTARRRLLAASTVNHLTVGETPLTPLQTSTRREAGDDIA